ncbi:hypothetical protein SDC9_144705 [bioreactor metagenome]|uniref:Uncharacterized protein n=1 Tax=bioreactor metagenome TaxID=1076179 RepID=A0A645E7Q4_9ZZZZ
MVASGQIRGHREAGLPDQRPVDLAWFDHVVALAEVADLAVFEPQPDLGGMAVHDVGLDVSGVAFADHDDRGQTATPGFQFEFGDRGLSAGLGGGVHTHCGHHRDDGVLGYLSVSSLPVPEVGGDAEFLGEHI